MPLADVIGQDAAVATLKSALLRDAVPQSYLFVGPEGVGKTTAAGDAVLRPGADRDAGRCVTQSSLLA
jgi:replication-associated recombination protein RarA